MEHLSPTRSFRNKVETIQQKRWTIEQNMVKSKSCQTCGRREYLNMEFYANWFRRVDLDNNLSRGLFLVEGYKIARRDVHFAITRLEIVTRLVIGSDQQQNRGSPAPPVFEHIMFLVGQSSLFLNKSGQSLKSIFSQAVRAFDLVPRLRARPKYQLSRVLC